ncbi:MAG: hypothetical protein LUD12_10095 [Lachnospiraceae bacterium]|nr:hypothetical protein [Lachnospiraceae bacterium]
MIGMLNKPFRQKASFEERLEETKRKKELYDQEYEIRQIRKSMRHWQLPTTTKMILIWLIINCTVVEIYSMVAMWVFMDLSALYSLITAVITETISFAVYAAKSYHETKQEEIIKLERSKLEIEKEKLAVDHSAPEMDETGDPDDAAIKSTESEG